MLKKFIFTEVIAFLVQYGTIFMTVMFSTFFFKNPALIKSFIVKDLNADIGFNFAMGILSCTFMLGIIALIKECNSSKTIEEYTRDVIFDIPRIFYLFGSSISSCASVISILVFFYPKDPASIELAKKSPLTLVIMLFIFGFIFLGYGMFIKFLVMKRRGAFITES